MHKIVHLIHHDQVGGGSTALTQHLRHHGRRYETWVLHGGRGPLARVCGELGLSEVSLPFDEKWKVPFGFLALIWQLRRIKPDLLILHGQWSGPIGALAGKLAGVPRMLYIAHWPAFYSDWDFFRINRNHLVEWLPTRLCDRLVFLSEGNYYQYMLREFPIEGKVTCLPSMIDFAQLPTAAEAAAIRRELGWTDDTVHVVSVGRIATQKKIDWLLRSWKRVQDSGVKAQLWIVGGGESEKEMRLLANALGLSATCTFLGSKPRGIAYLQAADVVAMTTLYEGHAITPLEAMACGRAIVANDVDGVHGSFTDGREGFLVPPGNIELFAERLLTLIQNPTLREEMGQRGKQRAEEYESGKVLDRYVALYDSELAR